MAAPYAAIRFGLRDSFAQLALVFGGLVTIIIFYWWIPAVLSACLILALSLITASMFARQRRALLALAVTTAFGFVGGLLTLYLAGLYQKHLDPGQMAEINSRVINGGAPLLATWILTTACSRAHHLFLRHDPGQPEADLQIKLDS